MKTLNFKAIVRLINFNISTGISEGMLFCPDYNINQYVSITYDQYQYLVALCRDNKYGRIITDNMMIIDRCFAKSIMSGNL